MIDLSKTSGLPIELMDNCQLKFNDPLKAVVPAVRRFADMKEVWLDQSAKPTREDMYYMYRDLHLPTDEKQIRQHNLRYDITILTSVKVGDEFNKTVGHYHPLVPGKMQAYPEMYEVLEGEALFLIQKVDESGKNIEDIQAITATVGDKVIYPPGYGHIIVNIGSGPLVTANWVADHFESIYQPVKDMAGMGYYVVADGMRFKFVPNPKYSFLPPIKSSQTQESGWGIGKDEPMYTSGMKNLDQLKFLTNPEILTTN